MCVYVCICVFVYVCVCVRARARGGGGLHSTDHRVVVELCTTAATAAGAAGTDTGAAPERLLEVVDSKVKLVDVDELVGLNSEYGDKGSVAQCGKRQ